MKPRNKGEKRVAGLNATLKEDISVRDIEWVKKQNYGRPKEGTLGDTSFYFTLLTKKAEYQVRRLYRGYKFVDRHFSHYFFVEIMREWHDGTNTYYFGKQRAMGMYYDNFLLSSPMELRGNYANYANNSLDMLFDVTWGEHKQSRGKRIPCERTNPRELGRIIKNNPIAETLYKNKDSLFLELMYGTNNKELCKAIVIAKRHGFVFTHQNQTLWADMVRAMIKLKADYHNPIYVAPKDLQATHDLFTRRLMRKLDAERRAAAIELKMSATDYKLMQEKRTNDAYIRRRKRFYDMVLTDGLIECRVLRDVQAFRDEANEMHHCVYTNEYYKKPYSLILSATISGNRVETCEVDLTTFKVAQCYGKHDQFTMHHDRIVKLVTSQMETIKRIYQSRRHKSKVKTA